MAVGRNNNNVVAGGGGEEDWTTILPIVPLMPGHKGTHHHSFEVSKEATSCMIVIRGVTHLRLNNFPSGEVARIRA
jgi:allantoicase